MELETTTTIEGTTSTTSTSSSQNNSNASRLTNLDLAFILDCTASMQVYIEHAKENIDLIANEIIKTESCSLRIGLIEFRDHPPSDYTFVTRVHDFTDDISIARRSISACTTHGGGDVAESICCGLSDCLNKLNWREDSVKLAILITDGPPHGLVGVFDDYFPRGCPKSNDPVETAHKMAEKAITLYCAGCEPSLTYYRPFFIPLTLITGGQYIPLDVADSLSSIIIGGSHEEMYMERLMDQVNNEVLKESATNKDKPLDEEELTKRIHFILNSNSNYRKHKKGNLNYTQRQKFNEDMKKMSTLKNLNEFNNYIVNNNISVLSSGSNNLFDVLDPLPLTSNGLLSVNNNINVGNTNINNASGYSNSSTSSSRSSSSNNGSFSNINRNISKRRKNNSQSPDSHQQLQQAHQTKSSKSHENNSSPDSSDDSLTNSNDHTSSSSSSSNNHNRRNHISKKDSSIDGKINGYHTSTRKQTLSTASSSTSQTGAVASGSSSTSPTSRPNINIDQARRLVKKSIARNNLKSKK